jgi:hypothetical protein
VGSQNPRAWDLSGSAALFRFPFRQNQRFALAQPDAFGRHPLGRSGVGAPLSHRTGTIGALLATAASPAPNFSPIGHANCRCKCSAGFPRAAWWWSRMEPSPRCSCCRGGQSDDDRLSASPDCASMQGFFVLRLRANRVLWVGHAWLVLASRRFNRFLPTGVRSGNDGKFGTGTERVNV